MNLEIIKNISEDEYRKSERLSQSDLGLILKSPLHFHLKDKLRKAATPEMEFGSAFHCAVLEPKRFQEVYAFMPETMPDGSEFNKRTKAYKEFVEKFKQDNVDKICLEADDAETLTGMLNSLASHPTAKTLFRGGEAEVTGFWNYRGYDLKGRLDYLVGDTIVELKTCKDASPQSFTRDVYNRLYDFQAAFYVNGFKAKRHIIVAIEKVYPYTIGVYDMSQWLEFGSKRMDRAFDKLDFCTANNSWEGYTSGVEVLLPATWVTNLEGEET